MSENKESSNTHDEDKKPVKDDASNLENIHVENELDAGELDEDNASPIGESNEELQTKNEELKDQLMRTLAESENLRKRTIKDVDQAKKYSHISFVRDLLSSVDNFKRALDSLPEDKADLPEPIKNLIIGLEIVEKEINSTFEKHNLKQISPLGEKFDYNFHQAMFEVPTNDTDPGIVIEVSQVGYLLYDRLVRPAMVGISKKIEENNLDNDNQVDN
ncbi:nucleotide exchange factor GrpE [Alphaproteobacteria bacterium]|nr:nucleotide exchange factor GrpE [Alphaproteobacteria bacterium]